MNATPDLFTNVHKGIRSALFEACFALGRADDAEGETLARKVLADALRFVAHHGENEDLLLVPLLQAAAPEVAERMTSAHADIHLTIERLTAEAATAPTAVLYARAAQLTSTYLAHMHEEELSLEPRIRDALSADEIASFGRLSVERTAPADQEMMLTFMLPAMRRGAVEAFFARLPPAVAEKLRPLSSAPRAGSAVT